ncbi:ribosomal protein L22 [Coniophora puteana RWD-64-598 SS2]|uniref:Ribosomal protein L22 n=1 Tax=Coniophora puteana (strain RWD-64-598) TaxID=741705 RepID=A0A5M3MBU4_CONPW|nr:ribosomal protein L22 [Coniophora puteana RWD-64-598 SS2]EIW76105.1 ribosomal protein L22 [Coniophora puteana RWD-64-598 SS2]
MQSLKSGVSLVSRSRQASIIKHTSSQIQQPCSRGMAGFNGPLDWVRQKFSPQFKVPERPKPPSTTFDEETCQAGKSSPVFVSKCLNVAWYTQHKFSTANFKISHRKLNMLGQQISGKPIDYAIMQMQFSEKRASKRIKSMLATAKHHATYYKNMETSKLIVAQAWVTKGPRTLKRLEPKGRGKYGIRVHPDSRMHVILEKGRTAEEIQKAERERKLKRIVSAGLVREDVPLRNPAGVWRW